MSSYSSFTIMTGRRLGKQPEKIIKAKKQYEQYEQYEQREQREQK